MKWPTNASRSHSRVTPSDVPRLQHEWGTEQDLIRVELGTLTTTPTSHTGGLRVWRPRGGLAGAAVSPYAGARFGGPNV